MGGRLTVLGAALAGAALLAAPGAAPAAARGGPASRKQMAAVVSEWTKRLDAKDNAGLARLYSLPVIVIQGPYEYRLKTREQVALFFSLLPCAGEVVAVRFAGSSVTAIFRLRNRGTTKCDAPGGLAAARFTIVKGKIAVWEQVPVPQGVSGNQRIA